MARYLGESFDAESIATAALPFLFVYTTIDSDFYAELHDALTRDHEAVREILRAIGSDSMESFVFTAEHKKDIIKRSYP